MRGKLGNQKFVQNAPENVVALERKGRTHSPSWRASGRDWRGSEALISNFHRHTHGDLPKEQQLIREVFTNFYESLDSKGVSCTERCARTGRPHQRRRHRLHPRRDRLLQHHRLQLDLQGYRVEQRAAVALPIITGAVESLKEDSYFDQPIFRAPITVRYSDGLAPQGSVNLRMVIDWSVTDTPLLPDSEKELDVFLTRLLAED